MTVEYSSHISRVKLWTRGGSKRVDADSGGVRRLDMERRVRRIEKLPIFRQKNEEHANQNNLCVENPTGLVHRGRRSIHSPMVRTGSFVVQTVFIMLVRFIIFREENALVVVFYWVSRLPYHFHRV